jgi:uncharacterized membrane protein YciS (DUF1049 family)
VSAKYIGPAKYTEIKVQAKVINIIFIFSLIIGLSILKKMYTEHRVSNVKKLNKKIKLQF